MQLEDRAPGASFSVASVQARAIGCLSYLIVLPVEGADDYVCLCVVSKKPDDITIGLDFKDLFAEIISVVRKRTFSRK
jgi:hypothetical protein